MGRDWVRVLLTAALCVLAGGAVFTAACAEVWPAGWPEWVQRVSSGELLGGGLLAGGALLVLMARRRG